MIARVLKLLAIAALVSTITMPASADGPVVPPPASAFAHLPMIHNPQLSPDGKRIALMYPVNGHFGLLIVDAKKTPESTVAGVKTDSDEILWYRWKTNNRLLVCLRNVDFLKTDRPLAAFHILSIDADGSNQIDIWGVSHHYGYGLPGLQDILPDDPEHILLVHGGNVFRVKVNVTGGGVLWRGTNVLSWGDIFKRSFYGVSSWIEDTKGNIRIGRAYSDGVIKTYYLNDSGDWDLINSYERKVGPAFHPLAFSEDGKSLYVASSHENGTLALYEFDPAAKSFKRKIFGVDGYDIGDAIKTDHHKFLGVDYTQDQTKQFYVDDRRAALQKGIDRALPNMNNEIMQTVDGGKSALIRSESPQEAGVYYLLTMGDHTEMTVLGSEYPELVPDQLATVTPVSYKARDGLVIHGYLTVPHGMEGKPLPFIILPHGGPTDRDEMEFNWWTQFLATRGYGVLQPNFRGSSGYGGDFREAGAKEWGGKMQDDVSDGLTWLNGQGLIKDNRVCIGGWSYGGYASLAGATLTPKLYRCAFSMAGVSSLWNLVSDLKYFFGYQDQNIPNVQTGERDTENVSPINHVADVNIPILLMHSSRDFTVPINQSQDFERALKSAGKHVEAVYFDEDDHYLGKEKNRLLFLNTLDAFLAKNLGPGELVAASTASAAGSH